MKKLLSLLLVGITTVSALAQVPKKISYQAVIRNSNNVLVTNQQIGMQISILQGGLNGNAVYVETQSPTTNANGLVSIDIGTGNVVTGNLSNINWTNGSFYIKSETDLMGGNNYTITGTSEILSVPFALYAGNAGSLKLMDGSQGFGKVLTSDSNGVGAWKTPTGGSLPNGSNPGQMLYWDGNAWVPVVPGTTGQTLTYCNDIPTWGPCPTVPVLSTATPTKIDSTSATVGGTITSNGNGAIKASGVCYATTPNPTLNNNVLLNGATSGSFSNVLGGLNPLTTYYLRAFATNVAGTTYGNQVTFKTLSLPKPVTDTLMFFAGSPNVMNSNNGSYLYVMLKDTNNGGSAITSAGFCWDTSPMPTIANNVNNGLGTYVSKSSTNLTLSNLTPGTTYYVRAYATNSLGTAYGRQCSYTTPGIPSVNTGSASAISWHSVKISGSVTNTGGLSVTTYGVLYDTIPLNNIALPVNALHPHIIQSNDYNLSNGLFTDSVTYPSLIPGKTYYAVAFAGNGIGIGFGLPISFTTLAPSAPTVSLDSIKASGISVTYVMLGATLNSDGGAVGGVTELGVCWNSTGNPSIADHHRFTGSASVGYDLYTYADSLKNNTTYYVRAYAKNNLGVGYSAQQTVKTLMLPAITTASANLLTGGEVSLTGNVTAMGNAKTLNLREFIYGTSPDSSKSSTGITDPLAKLGAFTDTIYNLTANTTYYYWAVVGSDMGQSYGSRQSFTTGPVTLPVLQTGKVVFEANQSQIDVYGKMPDIGGGTISASGICWSTSPNPTIANNKTTNGRTTVASYFTPFGTITGFTANTTYYICVYATNSAGTVYGNQVVFTTPSVLIGQSYQGGSVAYILQPGDSGYVAGQTHGIIIAPSDQSTSAHWGNIPTAIGLNANIGSGKANTVKIINYMTANPAYQPSPYAASICASLNLNGYADWYLPSAGEIEAIAYNSSLLSGITNTLYWSSSVATGSNYYGTYINPEGGNLVTGGIGGDSPAVISKYGTPGANYSMLLLSEVGSLPENLFYVRAVRSF